MEPFRLLFKSLTMWCFYAYLYRDFWLDGNYLLETQFSNILGPDLDWDMVCGEKSAISLRSGGCIYTDEQNVDPPSGKQYPLDLFWIRKMEWGG